MLILFSPHWRALTNTANFHEVHSTTNVPPLVLNDILGLLGSIGVDAVYRQKMADPGEPWIRGSRLIWAATDSTNWVVHYEYIYIHPGQLWTNYCVFSTLPKSKDAKAEGANGGYMRRFEHYKEFIDYERQPRRRF